MSAASIWLVALFAAPVPCRADFIAYYQTAQGAVNPTDGQPVDALVTFEATGTTLTITLTNLQTNPKAVSQNLSDVFFTFTTGETTGELVSSSADFIAVGNDNTFTPAGSGSTGWILRRDVSGGLELDLLGTGAAPTHTIIGPPAPDGTYKVANGSIAGNQPHNPFIDQTATFVLNVPISQESRIDKVIFSFGTRSGEDVPGDTGTPVPEPGSLLLLCTGLCAIGFAHWSRRK